MIESMEYHEYFNGRMVFNYFEELIDGEFELIHGTLKMKAHIKNKLMCGEVKFFVDDKIIYADYCRLHKVEGESIKYLYHK